MARYRDCPAGNEVGWARCGREGCTARTRVPDLRLDPPIVNRDRAGGKLDADRRPALDTELIADEPREHCQAVRMSSRAKKHTTKKKKLQKHTVSKIEPQSDRKGKGAKSNTDDFPTSVSPVKTI
jgi:hypothetical protein